MAYDVHSRATAFSMTLLVMAACAPGSESPTVEAEVFTGLSLPAAFEDGEGWTVQVKSCRAAIEDLRFTTGGEVHERGWVGALGGLLIGEAWAHPGHSAGGEVIGELPGRHLVEWCGARSVELGKAELTHGEYNGADFVFVRGGEEDGLTADDALFGYSLVIGGEARRGDAVIAFYARVRQDEGREVIGVPMDLSVDGSKPLTLELQLRPESLLAGIDFAALEASPETQDFVEGDANHNRVLRAAQSHESYAIEHNVYE